MELQDSKDTEDSLTSIGSTAKTINCNNGGSNNNRESRLTMYIDKKQSSSLKLKPRRRRNKKRCCNSKSVVSGDSILTLLQCNNGMGKKMTPLFLPFSAAAADASSSAEQEEIVLIQNDRILIDDVIKQRRSIRRNIPTPSIRRRTRSRPTEAKAAKNVKVAKTVPRLKRKKLTLLRVPTTFRKRMPEGIKRESPYILHMPNNKKMKKLSNHAVDSSSLLDDSDKLEDSTIEGIKNPNNNNKPSSSSSIKHCNNNKTTTPITRSSRPKSSTTIMKSVDNENLRNNINKSLLEGIKRRRRNSTSKKLFIDSILDSFSSTEEEEESLSDDSSSSNQYNKDNEKEKEPKVSKHCKQRKENRQKLLQTRTVGNTDNSYQIIYNLDSKEDKSHNNNNQQEERLNNGEEVDSMVSNMNIYEKSEEVQIIKMNNALQEHDITDIQSIIDTNVCTEGEELVSENSKSQQYNNANNMKQPKKKSTLKKYVQIDHPKKNPRRRSQRVRGFSILHDKDCSDSEEDKLNHSNQEVQQFNGHEEAAIASSKRVPISELESQEEITKTSKTLPVEDISTASLQSIDCGMNKRALLRYKPITHATMRWKNINSGDIYEESDKLVFEDEATFRHNKKRMEQSNDTNVEQEEVKRHCIEMQIYPNSTVVATSPTQQQRQQMTSNNKKVLQFRLDQEERQKENDTKESLKTRTKMFNFIDAQIQNWEEIKCMVEQLKDSQICYHNSVLLDDDYNSILVILENCSTFAKLFGMNDFFKRHWNNNNNEKNNKSMSSNCKHQNTENNIDIRFVRKTLNTDDNRNGRGREKKSLNSTTTDFTICQNSMNDERGNDPEHSNYCTGGGENCFESSSSSCSSDKNEKETDRNEKRFVKMCDLNNAGTSASNVIIEKSITHELNLQNQGTDMNQRVAEMFSLNDQEETVETSIIPDFNNTKRQYQETDDNRRLNEVMDYDNSPRLEGVSINNRKPNRRCIGNDALQCLLTGPIIREACRLKKINKETHSDNKQDDDNESFTVSSSTPAKKSFETVSAIRSKEKNYDKNMISEQPLVSSGLSNNLKKYLPHHNNETLPFAIHQGDISLLRTKLLDARESSIIFMLDDYKKSFSLRSNNQCLLVEPPPDIRQ